MKFKAHILYIILAAAALVGCSDDIIPGNVPSGEGGAGTGEMVFFSSGTTETEVSRAPSTYYMPDAHRFVCRMYYKAHTGSDLFDINGTDQTAWLKVSGSVGNSLYWNKDYTDPSQYDPYGNDKSAHAFYWQNRKPHAFLAWTDLNQATNMVGGDGDGDLRSHGSFSYIERKKEGDKEVEYSYAANAFDLTRKPVKNAEGQIVSYGINSMAQQPDIAQALTIQAPTGATQEGNRVNLYFRHQFSQVQVNIKNSADNSVTLTAADVLKVELLGVSEEGYVFTDLDADGNVRPAAYKPIDFSKYSEKDLEANKYGTSFDMFVLPEAETETGFLKSFNALTFGQLQAIRITWKEEDYRDAEGNVHDGVRHFPTYRIPPPTATDDLMNLKSGMRYIWNIEIRRGTLAVIRTEIVDWELPTDAPHNGHTEGTITN